MLKTESVFTVVGLLFRFVGFVELRSLEVPSHIFLEVCRTRASLMLSSIIRYGFGWVFCLTTNVGGSPLVVQREGGGIGPFTRPTMSYNFIPISCAERSGWVGIPVRGMVYK